MGFKRRSWFEISRDILVVCLHSEKKTRLIYQANLNSLRVNGYIDWLVNVGLLAKIEDGGVKYHTTPLGLQFLKSYRREVDLQANRTLKDTV